MQMVFQFLKSRFDMALLCELWISYFSMNQASLILFVGGAGSGKSTSLAALIDYRNTNSSGHIITIEDPIAAGYSAPYFTSRMS